jgi:phosphocarrier protein HPr
MQQATITVTADVGLHARPAALFVQTANRMKSDIQVRHGEKKANAKSILHVLSLGVEQGAEIEITAEGVDENEAIQTLLELIKEDFKEEGA